MSKKKAQWIRGWWIPVSTKSCEDWGSFARCFIVCAVFSKHSLLCTSPNLLTLCVFSPDNCLSQARHHEYSQFPVMTSSHEATHTLLLCSEKTRRLTQCSNTLWLTRYGGSAATVSNPCACCWADQGVGYSHRRWSHSHTFQSGGHTQTDGPTLLESFSAIHNKTTQFRLQFHTISWTSEEWEPSTLKSICLFTPGGGGGCCFTASSLNHLTNGHIYRNLVVHFLLQCSP